MNSMFNSLVGGAGSARSEKTHGVTLPSPYAGGLLISPERSRPRRVDTLTSVSLMLFGLFFFVVTLFFITELITITLS